MWATPVAAGGPPWDGDATWRDERIAGDAKAGRVLVNHGSGSGLAYDDYRAWSQDCAGVPDHAEPNDRFGTTLTIRNVGNGGRGDLVIGVPREDLGNVVDAGLVHVLYGTTQGLSSAQDDAWTRIPANVPGPAGTGDRLGAALP
jgi:hypothetical protein